MDQRSASVRVVEIIADLPVADIEASREFYAGYLGLGLEEFNLGWVARFTDPTTGAHVQVVTEDATAPEPPAICVKVEDVDAAHEEARRRGFEIVHPLRDEPWGVRRFFLRAPDGAIVTMVQQHAPARRQ